MRSKVGGVIKPYKYVFDVPARKKQFLHLDDPRQLISGLPLSVSDRYPFRTW